MNVEGDMVKVGISEDLEREKSYQLTLENVDAADGSTLVAPYTLTFSVSGGPKVSSVNIGKIGVNLNAVVIVTYDQDISQ